VKVELTSRHYGVHKLVKDAEIPGEFGDYATAPADPNDDHAIDEDKLIAALPDGFLPVAPRRVLLGIQDGGSSTGQRGLSVFRDWAKYFDAYTLVLVKSAYAPEPRTR
jgi:hypothetical protein